MAVLYSCFCAIHLRCKFLSHAHARTVLTSRHAVSAAVGMKKIPAREQLAPNGTDLQLADQQIRTREKAQQYGLAQGGLKYAWPQMGADVYARQRIKRHHMGSRRFQFLIRESFTNRKSKLGRYRSKTKTQGLSSALAVLYPCVCAIHLRCKFLSHAIARTVLTSRHAVSAAGHENPSSRAASSHLIPNTWNVHHPLKHQGVAGMGKNKKRKCH